MFKEYNSIKLKQLIEIIYIKHGNKLIILYQLLIVSRDRGKPIRDPTGLIQFFLQKMGSVLKISLSI